MIENQLDDHAPRLRAGTEDDIGALLEVEARAAQLLLALDDLGLLAMHSLVADDLRNGIRRGLLLVAELGGVAVGFALLGELGGHAHLLEMNVDPAHGRRGIGTRLLESACELAAARGLGCMTLVTLRDVAWNAPFYAKHGFVEWDPPQWCNELRALVQRERNLGIPLSLRIVMRRELSPP